MDERYYFFYQNGIIVQMSFKDWFKWYKYVIYLYDTEEQLSNTTFDLLHLLLCIDVLVHDDYAEAFYYLRDDLLQIWNEILDNNNRYDGGLLRK